MTALTKIDETPRAELIKVLQDSIWIGAKSASIEMALAYCRVNNLDPFLKPIHIVAIYDKKISGYRDVLMPGIADYRIKASRTDLYAGITEPEYGPSVTTTWGKISCTHPEWCKITVYRIVGGSQRAFVAREEWLENYAIAGGKEQYQHPNAMWAKRPKGQLAKCTEAQALRKAFPEFSGGVPTAEEMEGKSEDNFQGVTVDAVAERVELRAEVNAAKQEKAAKAPTDRTRQTVEAYENKISSCEDPEEWLTADTKTKAYREKLKTAHPDLWEELERAFTDARLRLFPEPKAEDDWIDAELAGDDLPEKPDPDTKRCNDLIEDIQRAPDKRLLALVIEGTAIKTWLARMDNERPDLAQRLHAAYDQRKADFA